MQHVILLDFLVAHPAYQCILHWLFFYEAILPRAGEVPPPFTPTWMLRWYVWVLLYEDNPLLLASHCSWIAKPGRQLSFRGTSKSGQPLPRETAPNAFPESSVGLLAIDGRLRDLQSLRQSISRAILETRALRRVVAHQRRYRSQELVLARYAAIYQFIQLSHPDYPVGRLAMDERLRSITCGCPAGACEHVEYIAKRLSPLSNRLPGRPGLDFSHAVLRDKAPLARRTGQRKIYSLRAIDKDLLHSL